MNKEPENFESLRKLLALKRHEQPPPGYFEQLPGEIRARLRSGEHTQTDWWQALGDEASWLQRLLASLGGKPALAGVFGMAMCAVVLVGIYNSGNNQTESAVAPPNFNEGWKPMTAAAGTPALGQPSLAGVSGSSTNPVLNPNGAGSVFDQIGVIGKPVEVNFTPAGK